MKILLVRNDNIGDLINTTLAITALRKYYPSAQIDILVNTENQIAIFNNPNVDQIYIYQKSKHVKKISKKISSVFHKLFLIHQIKKNRYDWAILFRFDLSKSSLTWMRAKKTIGTNPVFTHPILPHQDFDKNLHEVLFCFELLKPLGITYAQFSQDYPYEKTNFYLPESLKKLGALYQNSLGIHLSTRLIKNSYPERQFLNLIQAIHQEFPSLLIILTAAPGDFLMAENLAKTPGVRFIKTSSFLEAAAVFSNCQLVLTLDGGMAHVCPALGVKTLCLMDHSKISRWYPWGMQDLVLSHPSGPVELVPPSLIFSQIKSEIKSEIKYKKSPQNPAIKHPIEAPAL